MIKINLDHMRNTVYFTEDSKTFKKFVMPLVSVLEH